MSDYGISSGRSIYTNGLTEENVPDLTALFVQYKPYNVTATYMCNQRLHALNGIYVEIMRGYLIMVIHKVNW